ncbi:vascular endothelial growth factor receptor 1-like [Uloborus diversus]|uniref:vascular endothelial growth factor receptor 1-like n=1 Tax=Uloborus diversus TaxID=327109 RepID=UPI002409DE57|nr:vascular endothelial growth factor receptor 1-like [Uloborus diversus]
MQRKLQIFNHQLFQEGNMELYDPNAPLSDQVDLLPYDESWEFPKEKLKLGRTVGQGAFGRVVKALAFGLNDYETSTVVAVKMLKERADVNQQKALMAELKILIHLGHHVNIVNLMGAVTKNFPKGELLLMVEYCRYGNIRHFLHRYQDNFINEIDPVTKQVVPSTEKIAATVGNGTFKGDRCRSSSTSSSGVMAVYNPSYRQRSDSFINEHRISTGGSTFVYSTSGSTGSFSGSSRNYLRADSQEHVITTSDLVCYGFQCARGMEYLASKKLIHRDLAARNILLADEKIVKICDFGLAKDCYKYENYVKRGDGPLPIKWMSIESIWNHVFTTKSDVWSYGILMWELFTLGGNPYPGIDLDEEFYKKLKNGYRMEKPDFCPDYVYKMMQNCWKENPEERPNFSQIAETLGSCIDESIKQHYIDLSAPYIEMNQRKDIHNYFNLQNDKLSNHEYMNSEVKLGSNYDTVPPARGILQGKQKNEPILLNTLGAIREDLIIKDWIDIQASDNISDYLQMGEETHV